MAVQRQDLMCQVVSLSYDFDKRAGSLNMAERQSTDMTACVRLFTAVDPEVRRIDTFAGTKPDTIYKRTDDEEWEAALMGQD